MTCDAGCREDQDRVAQKWMEEQTKYEDAHLGNFRRIYPSQSDVQKCYIHYLCTISYVQLIVCTLFIDCRWS